MIGEKIKEARKLAGLSQKKLGQLLGLTEQAIYLYERGSTRPALPTLRKIAEHTKRDIRFFIGDDPGDADRSLVEDMYHEAIVRESPKKGLETAPDRLKSIAETETDREKSLSAPAVGELLDVMWDLVDEVRRLRHEVAAFGDLQTEVLELTVDLGRLRKALRTVLEPKIVSEQDAVRLLEDMKQP